MMYNWSSLVLRGNLLSWYSRFFWVTFGPLLSPPTTRNPAEIQFLYEGPVLDPTAHKKIGNLPSYIIAPGNPVYFADFVNIYFHCLSKYYITIIILRYLTIAVTSFQNAVLYHCTTLSSNVLKPCKLFSSGLSKTRSSLSFFFHFLF